MGLHDDDQHVRLFAPLHAELRKIAFRMIAITSVMGINGKNCPQTGNESSMYPVRLLFKERCSQNFTTWILRRKVFIFDF